MCLSAGENLSVFLLGIRADGGMAVFVCRLLLAAVRIHSVLGAAALLDC